MTVTQEADLTCAERVAGHWQSRRDDLYILYCTMDPRLRDDMDVDKFLTDQGCDTAEMSDDDKAKALDEQRSIYALDFSYVEPGTFQDQHEGYFRYQISWGGPSDEIRFYVNLDGTCHRAEYWFLDWFDGASINVTNDEVARALFEDFADAELIKLLED